MSDDMSDGTRCTSTSGPQAAQPLEMDEITDHSHHRSVSTGRDQVLRSPDMVGGTSIPVYHSQLHLSPRNDAIQCKYVNRLTDSPMEPVQRQVTWRNAIPEQELQSLLDYDCVKSGGTILGKQDIKELRSGTNLTDEVRECSFENK